MCKIVSLDKVILSCSLTDDRLRSDFRVSLMWMYWQKHFLPAEWVLKLIQLTSSTFVFKNVFGDWSVLNILLHFLSWFSLDSSSIMCLISSSWTYRVLRCALVLERMYEITLRHLLKLLNNMLNSRCWQMHSCLQLSIRESRCSKTCRC